MAYAINDVGQVVGSTGTCAPYNPNFQLAMVPAHPMLWEADGTPRYLGTLGGTGTNPNDANLAININNKGHAVGTSALAGDETGHAFLWTREKGMQDLGTLPGDFASGAIAINDSEQISGISIGPNGPRAFVWQNGVDERFERPGPADPAAPAFRAGDQCERPDRRDCGRHQKRRGTRVCSDAAGPR